MNKEKKNLLVFGYGLAVIFALIAGRLWIKYGLSLSKVILLGLAVFFLVITIFRQDILKAIYKVWMAVGHRISFVVTTVILSVVYFTVFTVMGVIIRLFKKDLLDRSLQPDIKTYWKPRKATSPDKESFHRQF